MNTKNNRPTSFFNVEKVIDANKYNFYSLVITLFIIIPLMILLHELTNGLGIGEMSFIELAQMSMTDKTIILHLRNIVIFGLMIFFVIKSYLSKEKNYMFVDRKKMLTKWMILSIPLLISIFLFFYPKVLEPVTSMIITLLMIYFYYGCVELLLLKFMKNENIDSN